MIKLITYSVIAAILSIVLGVLLARGIPVEIPGSNSSLPPVTSLKPGPYTMEELERARADMEARIEQQRQEDNKKPRLQAYDELRAGGGMWLTWLPWLLLPFVVRLKSYKLAVVPLLIVVACTITRLLLPLEFLLCSASVMVGVFLLNRISRSPPPPPNAEPCP